MSRLQALWRAGGFLCHWFLPCLLIDVFGLMSVVCQGIIIIFFRKLWFAFHSTVRLFFPNLPTICLDSALETLPGIPSRRAKWTNMAIADCWCLPAFEWDVMINSGPALYLSIIPAPCQNISDAHQIQLILYASKKIQHTARIIRKEKKSLYLDLGVTVVKYGFTFWSYSRFWMSNIWLYCILKWA